VLRRAGQVGTGHVVQECGIGSVDLQLPEDDGPVQLSAEPRDRGAPVDAEVVEAVAAAVGLGGADVDGLVVVAGCGLSFVYLPVRAAALARARAAVTDLGPLRVGQLAADPVGGIDVFAVAGTGDRLTVRSRVFCPEVSVPEDPATGSAALGLGIALVGTGRLPADGGRYHISQGVQMGRPSQLFARVEAAAGVVTRCHVAGRVAAVASGRIRVPPPTE
jgi:trans-2,3-dihydro-3-hydroxyanthranilate isomerase